MKEEQGSTEHHAFILPFHLDKKTCKSKNSFGFLCPSECDVGNCLADCVLHKIPEVLFLLLLFLNGVGCCICRCVLG